MFRKLLYFLQQALKNMHRSLLMTLVAAGTITITLIILGSFTLLAFNLNSLVDAAESRLELSVFLRDDLSEQEVWEIKKRLIDWDQTEDVRYISKDLALSRLKEAWSGDMELLELGEDNPLPASFETRVSDPHLIREIAEEVREWKNVDDVRYGKGILEPLFAVTHAVRSVALGLVILTGTAAVLIIANTIRLTVHARRREIEIMKFVGATNWFIRCPFLFEGLLLGFVGSLTAVIVIYGGYSFLAGEIGRRLPFLPLVWELRFMIYFYCFLILAGVLLGGLGSMMAVRRYIDV